MKRILVINPFGIGDVIFSMTAVEALRRAHPGAMIGFLCNERTEGLVRMNASVEQVFVFNRDLFRELARKSPFLFLGKLKSLLGEIKKARFDTLFDLSLGREYSFFAMLIGIKKRVGFDYKGRGIFLTHKKKLDGYSEKPVAEIQSELLSRTSGVRLENHSHPGGVRFTVSDEARSEASIFLEKRAINPSDKVIAVAPGGGRSWGKNAHFKQWDPERFAEVANQLSGPLGYKALLLGDAGERVLLEKTAALIKVPAVTAAGEPIDKVCALLLRADLLLCNDGGLLHLANALGVKTVSLFGPVDEKVYGPLGNETPHAVLTEPVPCRPCYQNFHFPPCPYEKRCLSNLSVEKVVMAARHLL